jgi:hypothetical protein
MSTRMDQRGTEQGPRPTQTQSVVWGWVVAIIVALLILWWIAAATTHRVATNYVPGSPINTTAPNQTGGATPGTTGGGMLAPNTPGGTAPGAEPGSTESPETPSGGSPGTIPGGTGGGNTNNP